jgi:predicted PurR-regulated permease PerM
MFTLPSMWNIIISTIVFVIAAWYLRRFLEAQGIPKGMARGLVVLVLAYAVSWGSGELVDWAREKMYGPEPVSQTQKELTELLNASGITPPN